MQLLRNSIKLDMNATITTQMSFLIAFFLSFLVLNFLLCFVFIIYIVLRPNLDLG